MAKGGKPAFMMKGAKATPGGKMMPMAPKGGPIGAQGGKNAADGGKKPSFMKKGGK